MRMGHSILRGFGKALIAAAALLSPWSALASESQTPVDRADPAVTEEELDRRDEERARQNQAPAVAEPAPRGGMTSLRPFVAGAIRVEGATALPPSYFTPAIEPYLGRELTEDDLRALAGSVASAARRAGYGLATAWIPQQDVINGVLRVRIDEGRIDSVEVDGPGRGLVEPRLAPLVGGPVRTAELERRLLVAGDVAGVSIGQVRLVRSGGRNVLRVPTGFERGRGGASIDNWGTAAVGPVRARLSYELNSLAMPGDRLSVGGVVTPFQPGEFQLVQAGYAVPVNRGGTEIGLRGYVGRTDPGAELRDRDLEGRSVEIEAGITHPLLRSRAESLWGSFDLTLRDSNLTRVGARLRDDRIVTAGAALFAAGRLGGGNARIRLGLVQGLGLLDATRRGDPLASRPDAGGGFTKLTFWGSYQRPLGGPFSLALSTEGQLATKPLLASEEFGLGGRSFLRGFDYREKAGDRGAAAALELRFDLPRMPPPLRTVQLYGYADAGRVTNLEGGTGGGSLASAGGGARVVMRNRIEAGVELGVPLTDGAFGRRPEPRFSFTIGARF